MRCAISGPHHIGRDTTRRRRIGLGVAFTAVFLSTTTLTAQSASKIKQFSRPYPLVWQAATEVVQERGIPIVQLDPASGVITTDFASESEDVRYKYTIRVARGGDMLTTVSAICAMQSSAKMGLTWEDERSDGREEQLLQAIAQRLDPNGPGPSVPSPNCLANFRIGGSVLRGTSYSSFEEFPGLTPEAAARLLVDSLKRESLTIAPGETTTDTFVAIGSIGGHDGAKADFTITPVGGGVRLSVNHRLPPGRRGRDALTRDHLCGVVGGIGRFTKPALVGDTPSAQQSDAASLETRLRKLDELYKKGLITESEYRQKRAELLKGI